MTSDPFFWAHVGNWILVFGGVTLIAQGTRLIFKEVKWHQ